MIKMPIGIKHIQISELFFTNANNFRIIFFDILQIVIKGGYACGPLVYRRLLRASQ